MHFRVGSHPCETFPANQDQFPRWKSSLQGFSCKLGSFSPPEIIPTRLFLQIRIIFSAGNHPSQTFLANQDAFHRWKSSLRDFSRESGSIPPLGIIPPRHFYQIRITSPLKIHPQPRIQANQDSSLTKSPASNASPAASKSSRSSFPAITSFFSNRQLLISQHLFSHQAFSFPGLIRSNAQKLCDRRCNILYAYILRLFSGLEIFSLDDERYGHILWRTGAVRSVMTAVVRGKP